MRAIILLGAPGSGKGTLAEDLVNRFRFTHVSTGELLRSEIKEGSEIGREAKVYMDRGNLVPDAIVLEVVKATLEQGDDQVVYMFDGFPRTREQASQLNGVLAELNGEITHVLLLDAPEDVLVDRIAGRRLCQQCGASYHVRNIPPKVEGVCDSCGGELHQRADDTAETVRNRLKVYKEQTRELINFYKDDLVVKVDASGTCRDTNDQIFTLFA